MFAGEEFYPTSTSFQHRGWGVIVNFIFNPKITLANFYNHRANAEKGKLLSQVYVPAQDKKVDTSEEKRGEDPIPSPSPSIRHRRRNDARQEA
jgi:hypothetical protein